MVLMYVCVHMEIECLGSTHVPAQCNSGVPENRSWLADKVRGEIRCTVPIISTCGGLLAVGRKLLHSQWALTCRSLEEHKTIGRQVVFTHNLPAAGCHYNLLRHHMTSHLPSHD